MIYLLVENRSRELWSRLLVAAALWRRGVPSVVGSQRVVWANTDALQPGVMVFKGANKALDLPARRARAAGHKIAVIDEECLNVVDEHRVRQETGFGFPADVSFCASPFVASIYPNGVSVGNPRIDLLTRPEIFGDVGRSGYVLVNTSAGAVNPACGSVQEYWAMCQSAGCFRSHEEYLSHLDHEWLKVQTIRRFIDHCDAPVVLRPHPSEDAERWRKLYAGKVDVVTEGSHIAWMRNARCVVHNGCTTAMEARYLGVPTLSLLTGCAEDKQFASNLPPYPSTGSPEEAMAMIAADACRLDPLPNDGLAHDRIAERLAAMAPEAFDVSLEAQAIDTDPYFAEKARITMDDVSWFCGAWGLDMPVKEIGDGVFAVG